MSNDTVYLFTRNGIGQGPQELQETLVTKFLRLLLDSGQAPSKLLFYTDGVRLACQGSAAVDLLREFEAKGAELVLCKTCLDYFGLTGQVQVGIVGGMGDIVEALNKAEKVVSV